MAAALAKDMVDPQCVKAINALLASKLPVNQQVDQMVASFKKYGLAYTCTVNPSEILCHPHNRANQMLSWVDMWDKGTKMLSIGMQKQFLGESIAIEISTDSTTRKEQLEANQKLIQESTGAMAPMNGTERFFGSIYVLVLKLKLLFCFNMHQPRLSELVHKPHHSFLEGHQPWVSPRRATSLYFSIYLVRFDCKSIIFK